jgi:hypothetical protein
LTPISHLYATPEQKVSQRWFRGGTEEISRRIRGGKEENPGEKKQNSKVKI